MGRQPKYEHMPERKVTGIGAKFISIMSPDRNNHIVIPKLWGEYMQRRDEIAGRNKAFDIGLCMGLGPDEVKSHPDELFYMAGAEVSDTGHIPHGMMAKIIPAGEYAVFTHTGRLDKLGDTMNYIYKEWLPKSGKKIRFAPDLEIYDRRFNPDSDTSEFDICIPVE